MSEGGVRKHDRRTWLASCVGMALVSAATIAGGGFKRRMPFVKDGNVFLVGLPKPAAGSLPSKMLPGLCGAVKANAQMSSLTQLVGLAYCLQ